jgi:hypothetical protein
MINANDETQWAYLLDPTFELINTAGKPLTGGWINVYVAGTRNKYYCASDFNGTLHPFDIPLDSLGANIVLASPEFRYDVYVYNKYGTLVMSRYNVAPVLGGSVSVSGINDIVSDDGTVTINQYGETFSLSIADTVSAVSGLDIRVQDLESSVTGIQEALSGKKDVQAPYSASGTNVQTITSVTQDANGVITVEYSDIQAQNPLTPGQYVTIDDDVISVTGLQPEGDYATKDYVDAAVSGLEPIDITSTDGSISVSSSVSGSVRVFDISVSGGQPVYFRGGDTWIPVNGTTADFSAVKKFDGTIVPSDIVSGTVPLEDGLWAWDAIVDIYVGGHVNELVKCGIKGQAVGGAYDPDSETELLIDSTRPGVINSFTLTGLSRGGPNTRLAFTFTRESSSTSTMWVRMRRLSVYQVKGPGVSQSGGGGDYEAGWGIIINGDVISVNNAIIPDIDTVSGMIQEAISGIPAQVQSDWTEDDSADPSYIQNKPQEIALVAGDNITITASGASAVIAASVPTVSGYVTEQELAAVSGDIVNQIPSVEITPALASGTKIAEYSIDGVSGELFAPEGGGSSGGIKNVMPESGLVITGNGETLDLKYDNTLNYDTLNRNLPIAPYYNNNQIAYIGDPWRYEYNGNIQIRDTSYVGIPTWFPKPSDTSIYLRPKNRNWSYSSSPYYIDYPSGLSKRSNNSFYFRLPVPNGTSIEQDSDVFDIVGDWSSLTTPITTWYMSYTEENGSINVGLHFDPVATASASVQLQKALTVKLKTDGGLSKDYYNGLYVTNPVPSSTSSDENKVLTVNSSGTPVWQPAQGGGSTYTAGDYISIENDEISVTGIDPDSFASQADLEAVSAAIPSGSYDLVAGQNITITTSGTDLIISGQQGGTNVTITPDYNSGTRVARYSIDGVNGSIYTPTQVNANWNETSSSSKAYIQNKPTIHTYTGASGVAIDANDVVSLDSPVELVPGANITIEVSGVSAIISSTGGGGGTTYTAGNMISLTNNAIAVSTTAGITDIQTVASLPANPVSTVLYLIPEA